ncbi:MAG: radical SAM protein [Candidatus Methanomethylicia archaeon]|nr:radical SAM protein [Candidatus Methanomethylicia archaeon]
MEYSRGDKIKVSYGTAIELGLIKGIMKDPPTTGYFFVMMNKCEGKCKFCLQSKEPSNMISRVIWPEFNIEDILKRPLSKFKRICIQCSKENNIISKVINFISNISNIPISISTSPLREEEMILLKKMNIDIITIPIDCASKEIFNYMKGENWDYYWDSLEKALKIFGKEKIGTHIIVGLGERECDIINILEKCKNMGIIPSLFTFTPIPKTELYNLKRPSISSYRRLQIARELIFMNEDYEFSYDNNGRIIEIKANKNILEDIIEKGEAFMTKGCPNCNRPYFNESPLGPIYNYPRKPRKEEIDIIRRELFAEGLKISYK